MRMLVDVQDKIHMDVGRISADVELSARLYVCLEWSRCESMRFQAPYKYRFSFYAVIHSPSPFFLPLASAWLAAKRPPSSTGQFISRFTASEYKWKWKYYIQKLFMHF